MNWRAEPANTPIVEQARERAVSILMALVFERRVLVEGGWNQIALENPERTAIVLAGRSSGGVKRHDGRRQSVPIDQSA